MAVSTRSRPRERDMSTMVLARSSDSDIRWGYSQDGTSNTVIGGPDQEGVDIRAVIRGQYSPSGDRSHLERPSEKDSRTRDGARRTPRREFGLPLDRLCTGTLR